MDDEDYSWVRRTRFSHSVVRSNSGREQFGAFVEQFNRGAALRQKGSASGFKLHGLNMEPGTRLSTSSLPTMGSFCAQLKPKDMSSSEAKPGQHDKAVSDRPSSQEASARQEDDAKAANRKKGIGKLSVAVPRVPAVQSMKVESPGALEFSFHPDE